MGIYEIIPFIAAAGFGIYVVALLSGREMGWRVPAALAVLFLAWSLWAVGSEGPFGFWIEHSRNAWGNQIWMDLLLSIGVALGFLVPRAVRVGVRPGPWVMLVLLTGGIGLLAFAARVLFVSARSDVADG